MSQPKHIVITGASSGLGTALARFYARPDVRLGLLGRNASRLNALATELQHNGTTVHFAIADVTHQAQMASILTQWDDAQPIELLIANAGISAGTGGSGIEDSQQVLDIFAVNISGVLHSIQPLVPRMAQRGHGQVALMSSLAGFRGYAGAPAYCGSKAAVRVFGEGLRATLADKGIAVNVICPGFVKTPMTDVNPYPMPFLMSAEKAARIIAKGLAQNKGRIAFPFPTYAACWLLTLLPEAWVNCLTAKMKKPGR